MGIIVSLISFALCVFFYVRMIRREVPTPLTTGRAVIPVVVGLAAPSLSTFLMVGFGLLFNALGTPPHALSPSLLYKSLITAFFTAGFTEEFIKLLLLLLLVRFLKPKNVYEYILFCAGLGVGFTLLEELMYGGGNPVVALARLPAFGLHVVFGVLMGSYWGLAAYNKRQGLGKVGLYRFLGLCLPVLWHTVFDAATSNNVFIDAESDDTKMVGFIFGVAVVILSVALQFVVLSCLKKQSTEYSAMPLA